MFSRFLIDVRSIFIIIIFLSSWITLQIIFRQRGNVKGLNIGFKNSNRSGWLIG